MALVMCHKKIYHSAMGKSIGLIIDESDLVYKILSLHSHKFGGLNSIDLLPHSLCGSEIRAQLSQSPLLRFHELKSRCGLGCKLILGSRASSKLVGFGQNFIPCGCMFPVTMPCPHVAFAS